MVKIPVKTVQEDEDKTDESIHEQEEQETETSSAEEYTADMSVQDVEKTVEVVDEEGSTQKVETEELPEAKETAEEEPEIPEEEDELTQLKKELAAKEQEAKEHYDARLRLQAEFDNFKKRKERETLDFRKYANEDFIRELLVIIDDFGRAIAAAEQTHKLEDFLKGVDLIFEKFLGTLRRKGVKEIEAEGQIFNPEIHEAITQIETDDVEEGAIATVFQKGYYLHDRVILAPKVGVAKKKES